MSAGPQAHGWDKSSRRRALRYAVKAPVDVTVLRSGIPYTVPGRSVNLCERGLAAVLAGELTPGETIGVEVRLPLAVDALRTRALVRHQDKLNCGMEFVGLSVEQQSAIRGWAEHLKAEADPPGGKVGDETNNPGSGAINGPSWAGKPSRKRRGWIWSLVLVLAVVLVVTFWWRWNRAWAALETGVHDQGTIPAEQPRVQVAAEVMEKLLVHRVQPDYPVAARRAKLQGVIVLDVVVGRDGSVVRMQPLNGPDVLARSAMEALHWWKFEPYRVNGELTTVETTVAVEFKP